MTAVTAQTGMVVHEFNPEAFGRTSGGGGPMEGCGEEPRRELANLGNALTMAERGQGRSRLSPADLMAWLLRVARLHPAALAEGMLFQLCDAIAGDLVEDADKIALVRMSWAAIVQSEFKRHGLATVEGAGGARAPAGRRGARTSRGPR